MAIAWSRISSKVIAHPPEPNEACRRRCGNGKGRSSVCIPHMAGKGKPEVRERVTHGHTSTAKDPTEQRSGPWPPAHDTPKNTPKPDGVATSKPRSAWSVTA